MNVNEYGVVLQLGVSFDMSSYTSLSLTFTKPDLTLLTVIAVLGVAPVTTPLGIFAANTYVTYKFLAGQVNQAGLWSVRLTYQDASPAQLISTIGTFTVFP
jgi:hypothetical protein